VKVKIITLLLALSVAIVSFDAACRRKPEISAVDRQRLNRAWAYFLYAEADVQLSRMPVNRWTEAAARNWVVRGLRQPELKVTSETRGFSVHISDTPELSAGLGQQLSENPKKPLSDTLIQVFQDTPASWNSREHLWHLNQEYATDYLWARGEDRFKFPLAFYQDPFPGTTQ
jgi:hypothetical protein